jgi:hypothetical protein
MGIYVGTWLKPGTGTLPSYSLLYFTYVCLISIAMASLRIESASPDSLTNNSPFLNLSAQILLTRCTLTAALVEIQKHYHIQKMDSTQNYIAIYDSSAAGRIIPEQGTARQEFGFSMIPTYGWKAQ